MKLARHDKILELITKEQIETQEDLARRLQAEGFQVTQATVSRDIRQLKLTKTAGKNGRSHYVFHREKDQELGSKYSQVLHNGFVSMDTAQNLLVIHTVSGMAMAVAAALDEMQISDIIGCIAGDNTVMCATKSEEIALRVKVMIEKMLNGR